MISTYALVSLDDVKEFKGLTTTDDDDFISNLINRYSTLFESHMNKNVLRREYTEYYDGGGNSILFVDQYPITNISGISDDSDWSWADTTLIDADSYRVSNDNYIIFRSTTLGDYDQNVKITYTAGYKDVPEDIKHACIKEVVRSYDNRQEVGITSKSMLDGSVSYLAQGLLEETTMILDKYRRIGVC